MHVTKVGVNGIDSAPPCPSCLWFCEEKLTTVDVVCRSDCSMKLHDLNLQLKLSPWADGDGAVWHKWPSVSPSAFLNLNTTIIKTHQRQLNRRMLPRGPWHKQCSLQGWNPMVCEVSPMDSAKWLITMVTSQYGGVWLVVNVDGWTSSMEDKHCWMGFVNGTYMLDP